MLPATATATIDYYRAVIDTDVYLSGDRILIVQSVYGFDYSLAYHEGYPEVEGSVILVEKTIEDGRLVTRDITEYESYSELLQELSTISPLIPMRPAVHLEAERLRQLIDPVFIEETVSDVFESANVEVKNIGTVFVFNPVSPQEYWPFILVQVDFAFDLPTGAREYYRKTVLVSQEDLAQYHDLLYFH
jgi:hypothetical protein